jgi:CubicO group peptidase (beta-lactamase class C family)
MLDVKIDPLNDSGGGGAVSTAADYLRFCQMMLNGGTLDGRRYLSPTTVVFHKPFTERWCALVMS